MLRHFCLPDLATERWRNGGGQTRVIADSGRDGGAWEWRISLADIHCDGAFSIFPGVDRRAILAHGQSLTLHAGTHKMCFSQLGDDHVFNGELQVTAELSAGPVQLFNVMTRRGRVTAEISVFSTDAELSPEPDGHLVMLVVNGEFHVSFDSFGQNSVRPFVVTREQGFEFGGSHGALKLHADSADACVFVAQLVYI